MRRVALVTGVALLALTGCTGGSEKPSASPATEPLTTAPPAATTPVPGSPGPQDPDARTYATTQQVIDAINARVPCEPITDKHPTVYAEETITCGYRSGPGEHDVMIAATFEDGIQEDTAVRYFTCPESSAEPGKGVIEGDGWMVVVDGRLAGLTDTIGGRFVHPRGECSE